MVPRKLYLLHSIKLKLGQFLGSAFGSVWVIFFTLMFDSSTLAMLPFIAIGFILCITIVVCLKNRLQPHWSYALKEQEILLKRSLLMEDEKRETAG